VQASLKKDGTASFYRLLAAGIAVVFAAFHACAEDGAPTVAQIQAQLQAVQSTGAYDAALREELTSIYNGALDQLRAAEEWSATASKYEQALETAPGEVARLQEALQQPPEELKPDAPTGAGAAVFEGLLARAESELASVRAQRAALEKELFERTDRRRQLPELLAKARRGLQAESAQGVVSEPDPLTGARQTLSSAKRAAIEKEIAAYEKEMESYEIRGQLLTLQLYKSVRESSAQDLLVQAWREALRARRQQEAFDAVKKAREALGGAEAASPRVRQIAERLATEDVALVTQRTAPGGLVDRMGKTAASVQEMKERQVGLEGNFKRLSQKVDAVGLNNSIGLLLRRYREDLPDISQHRGNLRARQEEIAAVQVEQIDLQEKRLEVEDTESLVRSYLSSEQQTATPEQLASVEQGLRSLLQIQRDTLDALLRDYDTYFERLVDLDNAERALVETAEKFSEYIDGRVLWVRSGVALSGSHFVLALKSLREVVAWEQWRQVPAGLWRETAANPHLAGLLLAVIAAAAWLRRRGTAEMAAGSEKARSSACTSFKLTRDAVAATFLLSLPAIAIVGWVGHRLAGGAASEPFARAVGEGLRNLALVLFPLEFARQSMRGDGLFCAHFGWPRPQVDRIRRNLVWLMPVVGATVFVLALLDAQGEEYGRESLGRLVFMAMLVAVAVIAHRLFHPRRGAVRQLYDLLFQSGSRFRYAWYVVLVAMPVVFAALVFSGYFYTVYRLTARLYETAVLFFALVVARGIILRWLLLAKRRLAMDQMRKKRQALKSDEETSARDEAAAINNEVDLARVDVQTHRIVRSVIALAFLIVTWFIWTDELPALGILNQVAVWPSMNVTLGNVLTGIVIVVLTVVATANLPGLLELTVLQRMHYLKGERYAITTIVRYAIAIVGFSAAFHNFGIGWSRIQWLVAALGVGLGFGLQEIFANFISGLIILFERPIRIGDIVTIGGISGTVARIRTRATTIVDFERKELVVPNKDFITNQVINWTLTDSVLRVTIKVGIAYGSDTQLAERLLYEVAGESPDVLKDPAPLVLFNAFGESSLNFELRAFCGNVDCMLSLYHALNMAVDRKFREADIEIAFPQRDIHIRGSKDALPAIQPEKKTSN